MRSPCFAVLSAFVAAGSPALAEQNCNYSHPVQSGETLSLIAFQAYGDRTLYPLIHEANMAVIGPRPELLRVGAVLAIPCLDDEFTPVSADISSLQVPEVAPPPVEEVVVAEPEPEAPLTLEPLMTTEALAGILGDPRLQIVDLRREGDGVEFGYIPGSLALSFDQWRGPGDNPGAPPSDAALSQILSEAGLDPERPTVIVAAKDHVMHFARGAFVYWILKSAGFTELALLEGGGARWASEGRTIDYGSAVPQPQEVSVTLATTWRATPLEVAAIATGQMEGALLDGRPAGFFRPEQEGGVVVPSTIHGAQNLEGMQTHRAAMIEESGLRELEVLDRLKNVDVAWEEIPVVNFCSDGTLSAVNWFYASEVAGIANVKLYPESIKGWAASGNPVAVGTLSERLYDMAN
ncbi:rhodanese-like domain-containing protein [Pontivivens ytuae]|uniref:Thiosulfate sulfurtransferase n=1 Tax=Pontivivens ytuae TaxID=2789856 RepID=A0A7S9QCX3_9RHOB|nr:rhodanese-like domain-containing protein [Pontivivens ytuae]QPH53541.1 hypothetical protein I0K15_17430 [Pontivivens ytuae]